MDSINILVCSNLFDLVVRGLVNPRQEQIAELRAAIAAQESMRSTLGDATLSSASNLSAACSNLCLRRNPFPTASRPRAIKPCSRNCRGICQNNWPIRFGRADISKASGVR